MAAAEHDQQVNHEDIVPAQTTQYLREWMKRVPTFSTLDVISLVLNGLAVGYGVFTGDPEIILKSLVLETVWLWTSRQMYA